MSPSQAIVNFFIYPGSRIKVPKVPPEPLELKIVKPDNKHEIVTWIWRQKNSSDSTPVVVHFHGNGENLESMRVYGTFKDFNELQVNLVALDYPGYGNSTGKPSEELILRSADSLMAWVIREFPHNPKFICGWSLGAAVAIPTAAKYSKQIKGLIVISSWSSLRETAYVHYPDFLVNWLIEDEYNSVKAARTVDCPALALHGARDRIIPAVQGKQVSENFPGLDLWREYPGYGHNDILSHFGVWGEIAKFIEKHR
jgi:pimeloyl-ACP methyl ester carboxylesterase